MKYHSIAIDGPKVVKLIAKNSKALIYVDDQKQCLGIGFVFIKQYIAGRKENYNACNNADITIEYLNGDSRYAKR